MKIELPDLDSFGFDKVDAPCPHYGGCGGCFAQNISEADYKRWKTDTLKARLDANGIAPEIMGEAVFIPHATRRRATFAAFKKGKDVTLGFHRAKSHDIEPIDKCLLLTPKLNQIVANLKPWLTRILKDQTPTDIFMQDIEGEIEMMIIGSINTDAGQRKLIADMCADLDVARVGWQKKEFSEIESLISMKPIPKTYGGLVVDIAMGAFLQPSVEGEAVLVSLVMGSMPKKSKLKIADLFAGCGTFSGPALKLGHVHAVEETPQAIAALQSGVKKVQGLSAEKRDLMDEPMTVRELKSYDVVILDPPRAGALSQCEKLAKSTVKTVISVSCNPATFARDAKVLMTGGYKFKKLTMVDQFIWSQHTEVVGVFSRD